MKTKRQYQCEQCGAAQSKWAGQCPDCGQWNTLVETLVADTAAAKSRHASYSGEAPRIVTLGEVRPEAEARYATGIGELDRVLGGGLVAGSIVLLGGDPGIGKSTLLLQSLALVQDRVKSLYVSGEESSAQIAMRASRLALPGAGLRVLTDTDIDRILALARAEQPGILVIDSIQTVYSSAMQSAPGSIAQVRECAAQLVRFAKNSRTAVYLIGHVTKEGALAGPRVLEHMVDAVLYFEGEQGGRYRLVRAFKNRFGAVNELGVFAMTDRGLKEVTNPSAMLLSRHEQPVPGSVVMVTREGTRPLLVEVQALVDQSVLANPRRVTVGLEHNRLAMLLAVLHRHGGVATGGSDVFANIVGGVRVTETGADLATLLAVISSLRDRPVAQDLVAFGEIGLAGEIRPVQAGPERLKEAAKHGFKRAIVPKANAPKGGARDIEVIPVSRLAEALDLI
ncbi:MAG: DNA repair protein RadA [Gammaproteobacteria bacterium]|nr:DNA repair protein RadA [Gammaproteobacteria bacterium]MBI5617668.1 DNA repair protein RadA [Gammaproteobacteria bacterium]